MKELTSVIAVMLLVFSSYASKAQEFWFPATPKNTTTTVLRTGRSGIGIPTSSFTAFNNSTGRYSVANRVGFLVQGSNFTDVFNIGHLLSGNYGTTNTGDVWTSIGGPGSPGISGLPIYGTRHQFDGYAVNMALTDRNIINGVSGTSGIRDAILFWDASTANNSRMYIGKTLGFGQISPDIVINANGNVGVGTAQASTKFQVEGISNSRNEPLAIIKDNRATGSGFVSNFAFAISRSTGQLPLLLGNTGATGVIAGDGGLSLGTITSTGAYNRKISILSTGVAITFLTLSGDAVPSVNLLQDFGSSTRAFDNIFADDFINISDRREKEGITPMDYGLEHILKLEPVSYTMKQDKQKQKKHGLIAQDVQEIIPEVVYDPKTDIKFDEEGNQVKMDENARMGIAYTELIPILVKSIQQLNDKVDSQQKIIDTLLNKGEEDDNNSTLLESSDSSLKLYQNIPNPTNGETTIKYNLPLAPSNARLILYDTDGNKVKSVNITKGGEGEIKLNLTDLNQYSSLFYILYTDNEVSETKRLVLSK